MNFFIQNEIKTCHSFREKILSFSEHAKSYQTSVGVFFVQDKKKNSPKFENGILLPKLLWPTVRKIVQVIEKNFWNSRLKAENLQKFWDH